MKELIKKIIRRILGWYIHPLYHEDERIREEMTGYQEQLGTERKKLEEQGHILRDLSGQIQQMAGMQGCLDQQQLQIEKLETEMPSFQEELLQNAEGIQEQIRQLAELRGQLDQQKMRRDERELRLEECLNRQQSQIDEYAGMIQSLKDELLRNTNSMVEQNQQILNIGGQLHEIKTQGTILDSKQAAVVYAYRYLLNREPEDPNIIAYNMRDWKELREELLNSSEYRLSNSITFQEMPYFSLDVTGITYFYNKEDIAIPNEMLMSGKSWGEADIQNFIKISDQQHYGGTAPREGLFLDIGGNIGTTSIYCKLKLKPSFRFIAFEPVSETAKLLSANIAVNGAYPDIIVERVALSNLLTAAAERNRLRSRHLTVIWQNTRSATARSNTSGLTWKGMNPRCWKGRPPFIVNPKSQPVWNLIRGFIWNGRNTRRCWFYWNDILIPSWFVNRSQGKTTACAPSANCGCCGKNVNTGPAT